MQQAHRTGDIVRLRPVEKHIRKYIRRSIILEFDKND
jgi:hypothetical protein